MELILVDEKNNWLSTGDFYSLECAFKQAKKSTNYQKGTKIYAFELKSLIPETD